eukprot:141232-Prymnesium_polylepis.2
MVGEPDWRRILFRESPAKLTDRLQHTMSPDDFVIAQRRWVHPREAEAQVEVHTHGAVHAHNARILQRAKVGDRDDPLRSLALQKMPPN